MEKLLSFLIKVISKITGRKNLEKVLIYSAKTINTDLHRHGLIQIGGSRSQSNGELSFIINTLTSLLKIDTGLVFFDVGANVGNYSIALREFFSNASIYAFEPVEQTFKMLNANMSGQNIQLFNLGLGEKKGTGKIFNTIDNADTEVASIYEDVFVGIFKSEADVVSVDFEMDTIDLFCETNDIKNIDFLKIDVEGHELSVLKGAKNMLKNKNIKIVQFEFNSHNVYSRVFLRDFYLLLEDFEFFRIIKNGIVKLGPYSHANEIFVHQNFVAIQKNLCSSIKPSSLSLLGR